MKTRQPWEMTLEEYGGPNGGSLKRMSGTITYRQHNKEWHYKFVAQAILEGKIESHPDYPSLNLNLVKSSGS
jgi:hypothetical protein